jgi:hypothetical protein
MSIPIPRSPQFEKNERLPRKFGDEECFLCARPMKAMDIRWGVECGHAGGSLLTADEAAEERREDVGANLGQFPIGSDCAKKLPVEYRISWRR